MPFLESPWLPNVYFLSLVAGLWASALALVSPGTGALEVTALFLLAGAALGVVTWPINTWAFLPLVLGAASFFVALLRRRQAGAALAASAVLISFGSTFLFAAAAGGPAVHPVLAVTMTALTVVVFWAGVRRGLEVQRAPPEIDAARVVGQVGETRTAVHREGAVYVAGELWSARSEVPIEPGTRIRVRGLDGLIVEVEPAAEEG